MISVLIPTYNYKCYATVSELRQQLEDAHVEYEIIVADDGGKDQVVAISNHRINELPHCRFIRRRENVGRAAIRNFLVNEAKGEWCVIMDSDARVIDSSYISTYLKAAAGNPEADVIAGGLVNPPSLPSPEATLRYTYEKKAEPMRKASYRRQHPYAMFSTFNFMIRRECILSIPFDTECREYGFEDTLMGIQLQRNGRKVLHIDNPLMHMGFDSNKMYLEKTETSLRTLHKISAKILPDTNIGRAVISLRRRYLTSPVRLLYKALRPMLLHNLLGSRPSLRAFAFYKLGYYLSL